VLDRPRPAVEDEKTGRIAPLERPLCDELRRKLVIKFGRLHADIRSED
jgi:hypothetical protein